jgi:hypothetical protein
LIRGRWPVHVGVGESETRKGPPIQESLLSFLHPPQEGGFRTLWPLAPLPSPLSPNGSFPLPLPLSTGLLVEAPLPKLGIEAGPLDLSLETPQCPIEAFVVLNENFQTDHTPFIVKKNQHSKVEQHGGHGNRPSLCRVWE